MVATYDDNTGFAEDEKGEPICYDWLRDTPSPPVRVQVKKSYVEKEWGLSWSNADAVAVKFDRIKGEHVEAARSVEPLAGTDYGVYTIA